jgi:tRNA/rRNA methyltransferase
MPAGRTDRCPADQGQVYGGTERLQIPSEPSDARPAIVLVEPQLGQNIGAAARAMLNCGLGDLRLVRPRDGWPSDPARAAAAGADRVVEAARVYPTTEAAVADLHLVYAATARPRDMIKPTVTPAAAALAMRESAGRGARAGVLFGRERSGLENDDVALADAVLTVPLNPAFSSLNLSQAVLLVGYEWYRSADAAPEAAVHWGATRPATKAELVNFFRHLEEALDDSGFLALADKRPRMVRNIRNLFQRATLSEQEVNTLHGIVKSLRGKERRRG